MDSALFEFSKEFNMPLKETSEAYDRLVTLGVIFSPSRSAEEFFSRKHPARFAPVGPTANSSSTLSFGPFAIRRADYEKLWKDLPDKMRDVGAGDADASAAILLSFKRCQYEKLGAVASDEDAYEKRKLGFFANDDAFYPLVSVTSMWNLETPVVREKWVWFLPGERCRKLAEKITGEKFGPEDYSWWDVEIDFGDGFEARTPKDFANEFSFSPEYILGPWSRYLPLAVIDSLYVIYSHATTGLKFTKFDSISDILRLIRHSKLADMADMVDTGTALFPDRELLVKELLDFNGIAYPVDAEAAFDLICRLGFIVRRKHRTKVGYYIVKVVPDPKSILKFPTGWEDRIAEFVKTGSALFAYIRLREIE